MRLFLCVSVPDKVKDYVYSLRKNFSGRIRFVEKDNIHITLHFIGEADPERIMKKLEDVRFEDFDVVLKEMDLFPDENLPRVIVLSLDDCSRLSELNQKIVLALGVKNDRPFRPHLTIGRVKKLDRYEKAYVEKIKFRVDSFSLMKSTLTPDGPVYEEIRRFSNVMLKDLK